MNYWILKSEPEEFSIDDLIKQYQAPWDGVRNYQARNNMKLMRLGDLALFYHSGKNPAIVGVCKIVRVAYPDPEDPRFVIVDVEFVEKFSQSVSLAQIKATPELSGLKLIKQPRLSVIPITDDEFRMLKQIGF